MSETRVSAEDVKSLRERTGAGVMECKRALEETAGDQDSAAALLEEWGAARAAKRSERETSQGLIEAYVHAGGRVGAMVELNCETDFVARTDDFKRLAHDVALQVVGTSPLAVSEDDLPSGAEGDPAELCLLRQPFVRDSSKTVDDVIKDVIAKTGENIRVRRFARFQLGE
jgi:elongation factor Ts